MKKILLMLACLCLSLNLLSMDNNLAFCEAIKNLNVKKAEREIPNLKSFSEKEAQDYRNLVCRVRNSDVPGIIKKMTMLTERGLVGLIFGTPIFIAGFLESRKWFNNLPSKSWFEGIELHENKIKYIFGKITNAAFFACLGAYLLRYPLHKYYQNRYNKAQQIISAINNHKIEF